MRRTRAVATRSAAALSLLIRVASHTSGLPIMTIATTAGGVRMTEPGTVTDANSGTQSTA